MLRNYLLTAFRNLQKYKVFSTSIQWWVFVPAGGITALIALFTIGLHSVKVAMLNPVKSLRAE